MLAKKAHTRSRTLPFSSYKRAFATIILVFFISASFGAELADNITIQASKFQNSTTTVRTPSMADKDPHTQVNSADIRSKYRVLFAGATGAVGRRAMNEFLDSARCDKILALVRKDSNLFDSHPNKDKIDWRKVDFDSYADKDQALVKDIAAGGYEVAVCTLGTSTSVGMDKAEVLKIETQYRSDFAKVAKLGGIKHFTAMTSGGADPTSMIYVHKVQGMAETNMAAEKFDRTTFFKPGGIEAPEDDERFGKWRGVLMRGFKAIQGILPRKYHTTTTFQLGRAMRINVEMTASKTGLEEVYYPEVKDLLALDPIPATPKSIK